MEVGSLLRIDLSHALLLYMQQTSARFYAVHSPPPPPFTTCKKGEGGAEKSTADSRVLFMPEKDVDLN
jgi:hypothetical protein